jgi:hypothetical protein
MGTETAERYGWINRAVPAGLLDEFVERLARNIAALPDGVVAAAKHAIVPDAHADGPQRENDAWSGLQVQIRSARPCPGPRSHQASTAVRSTSTEATISAMPTCFGVSR